MLRPGEPWAVPADASATLAVQGSDAELASALAASLDPPVVEWIPSAATDLGRSVGRAAGTSASGTLVAPMDLIATDRGCAVNAVRWGVDPRRVRTTDRMHRVTVTVDNRVRWQAPAFAVIVANGEFVAGVPVAPKAHPGDGRLDVVIFAVPAGQRRSFRARLAVGDHLPHPRVTVLRGRHIVIESAHAAPVVMDGEARGRGDRIEARCESDRWRLML